MDSTDDGVGCGRMTVLVETIVLVVVKSIVFVTVIGECRTCVSLLWVPAYSPMKTDAKRRRIKLETSRALDRGVRGVPNNSESRFRSFSRC